MSSPAHRARVEFCGEVYPLSISQPFVMGRGGDLSVDENPYLHRRFLQVTFEASMWWLSNLGSQLTATVSDGHGSMQAWLAPGARLPLVFELTIVWFTAGPTTYELEVYVDAPAFSPSDAAPKELGATTVGPRTLTPDQKLMIVALCEPVLRRGVRGASNVPSTVEAAARLGWTVTKFNRKLDNVCDRLTRGGVVGLHGGPTKLATARRARLVEFALATRLVQTDDLVLLPPK